MNTVWYAHLGWLVAAGLMGFAITLIFSAWLRLPRNIFLVPYIGFTFLLFFAYIKWSELSIQDLILHNWVWGLIGAAILAVITIRNVLSQPASPRPQGLKLTFEILWPGLLYGFTDGLLLSVFPVLVSWQAFTLLKWDATAPGRILMGLIAILASMFVTTAYHFGYVEFRGKRLILANVGNTVMTLGYLATANPLSATVCHAAMHIAAVLHGSERVAQLPPHYNQL
jgi:hypothetical protein